jgi:hypothetical protein
MTELPAYVLLVLRALLAASLYAFLGWALSLIWKELRQAADAPSSSSIPPIHLSAPQHPEFTFPDRLASSTILIGRDAASDCCLPDETVSARHARVSFSNSQWWLEDLGSRNGTYLNGIPVESPIVLVDQDSIQIGRVTIRVDLDSNRKEHA